MRQGRETREKGVGAGRASPLGGSVSPPEALILVLTPLFAVVADLRSCLDEECAQQTAAFHNPPF